MFNLASVYPTIAGGDCRFQNPQLKKESGWRNSERGGRGQELASNRWIQVKG